MAGMGLVVVSLSFGSCASDPGTPEAESSENEVDVAKRLHNACSELSDDLEAQGLSEEQVLTRLQEFGEHLQELESQGAPAAVRDFAAAVDASIAAARRQLEATKAQDLTAALDARLEAAEAKLEIYQVVQSAGLPSSCAGESLDDLEAGVFAGKADLICADFVTEFANITMQVEGGAFRGGWILREVVPAWRGFVSELQAALPSGASRSAAQRMVGLYENAGDALIDLAKALQTKDEQKGEVAQGTFLRSSGQADRIAEAFGITQCSNILGLSEDE